MHKSRRRNLLLGGWLAFFFSIVVFIAAGEMDQGALALVGVALVIASVVLGLAGGHFIQVKKIDDNYVWLKGVHPAYVNGFQQL